jgi:hypothetical protein
MSHPSSYSWYLGSLASSAGTGNTGLPKLEGEVYVPLAGWQFSVTDVGGTHALTVPGGSRYFPTSDPTSLLATIEALLNGSGTLSGVFVVGADDDYDGSTGRIVISSSLDFAITWTSTALRNALGYTANLSGADEYVSPNATPHIWLPDGKRYPARSPDGHTGVPLSASTVTVSPMGKTRARKGAVRRADVLEFGQVRARKVWQPNEQIVNESFETFWNTNFPRRIRYHKHRADDATFVTYRPLGVNVCPCVVEAQTATWTTSDMALYHVGPFEVLYQEAA